LFRYLFAWFGLLFNFALLGSAAIGLFLWLLVSYYSGNLPTADEIENYNPATLSRVYDENGNILGIFGPKNRIYTPSADIPALVKNAFISAEDKNFFSHTGYDPVGLLKAIVDVFRGKKLRGASTITQQVMKNFLLSGERTGKRKIKEIILASKLEKVLSKEQILTVYLNEIYLGQGAYGITAAAITYFDKRLDELSVGEAAFLAALPKAPSFYHPIRQKDKSIQRRNFVIKELNENGYIPLNVAQKYIASDLVTILSDVKNKKELSLSKQNSYFTDAIKRTISSKYNKRVLETNGLTIRATLQSEIQWFAKEALQRELITFDQGLNILRGPVAKISIENLKSKKLIQESLSDLDIAVPVDGWFVAVITKVLGPSAEIVIARDNKNFVMAKLNIHKISWLKRRVLENKKKIKVISASDAFDLGDVVFVSWHEKDSNQAGFWSLMQVPEVQGAFIVMEPNSGKILAMQGGFSYSYSSFNRAFQAKRQPGSLFKPFVYLAALENGFYPNSIIVDAPISVQQAKGIWEPVNSSNKWFGVAPLRKGLEFSRNLMTVRLAKVVGMKEVKKYAELFGLYENMSTLLSYSLGAGETTLLKLVTAYSILANGGFEVEPSLFDLVQDRYGKTIYKHGDLKCLGCQNVDYHKKRKPVFLNMAKRLVNPVSIFQINSMLQGVVERGTASQTVGKLGLPFAGKTGTTNKSKDAWFIGYTPNLVAGCYMGYDMPKSLGRYASGGSLCGNVFKTFVENSYKKKLVPAWKPPAGTKFVNIDYNTGEIANIDTVKSVKEIFRNDDDPEEINTNRAVDGGFGMGQDLLLFNQPLNENVSRRSFLRKSFGAITTGDQY
jgi:penicillin-binding protein 1A